MTPGARPAPGIPNSWQNGRVADSLDEAKAAFRGARKGRSRGTLSSSEKRTTRCLESYVATFSIGEISIHDHPASSRYFAGDGTRNVNAITVPDIFRGILNELQIGPINVQSDTYFLPGFLVVGVRSGNQIS